MRYRFLLPLLAGLAALVTGCADPVVFAEVFQQQQGQKLYTRYNLWYTDPDNISCLNIQEGSLTADRDRNRTGRHRRVEQRHHLPGYRRKRIYHQV
ncbi:MAG: hypothetical protein L6W00_27710 [Lentisphaeria bacterium]|nr:MAG: hypothetical protein L6W00_27710 [Lentisphaeria bacterium]